MLDASNVFCCSPWFDQIRDFRQVMVDLLGRGTPVAPRDVTVDVVVKCAIFLSILLSHPGHIPVINVQSLTTYLQKRQSFGLKKIFISVESFAQFLIFFSSTLGDSAIPVQSHWLPNTGRHLVMFLSASSFSCFDMDADSKILNFLV